MAPEAVGSAGEASTQQLSTEVDATVGGLPARRHAAAVPLRRRVIGAAIAVVGLPLVTFLLLHVSAHVELSTALLSYLTLTMVVAAVGGVWPSLPTAVAGFTAANWFFTSPFRTWSIDRGQDLLALAVFLAVALVVSGLVHLVAVGAADAARADMLAEGNRVRTALLSAVSHDLRTPLSTIKAWLTGLLEGDVTFSPSDVNEILTAAVGEVDRLNALVGNLLDMSRLQTGAVQVHTQPVALDAVASAAVATLPHRDGRLHVSIPDTLPEVDTDAALLERVVANLVDNALRHTPSHCPVELRAGCTKEGAVVLHIIDHGPGLHSAAPERIFEPFQRLDNHADTGGAGLGLAVAKGLADAVRGDLAIQDTPGGGTTMLLTLPTAS